VSILGLANFFHVAPPAGLAPTGMKDTVNHGHVGQETGLKRPITLDGLKACCKLVVGQVMMQDQGPNNKLTANGKIGNPWLAKQGRVFGSSSMSALLGPFKVQHMT
jgi:hypothetical protein